MICAGIDAGSRSIKAALVDTATKAVLAMDNVDQGIDCAALSRALLDRLARTAGIPLDRIACIAATGYGRAMVDVARTTITEITCHARGVHHVAPDARMVIEIGGQDSKVLWLEPSGAVQDFAMNDRCAAGTGRFLEMVAQRFDLPLDGLGALAGKSKQPAAISSMCVVFAETEIIGLLSSGTAHEDIVAGVQHAIAARVVALAGRMVREPVVFTGGVALVSGMDKALEAALKKPVTVAPQPQYTGALGAALLAAKHARD